jgi:Zn-dependent peptidase ImmA (M78 family)
VVERQAVVKEVNVKSFKHLFQKITASGEQRHKLRSFNLSPCIGGKAKSVKEFAEELGFNVYQSPLRKGMSGRLVSDPFSDNGYAIEVNERESVQSRRWSVLHEIGHFFLHPRHKQVLADDMFLDRSNSAFYVDQKEEVEANSFASVLLFGDGVLRAAVSLHGGDNAALAKIFGVSEKTIEIGKRQFLK